MVIPTLALLVPAAVCGALGRRWAGGLLSSWVGRDLGDWPARAAWGLIGLPWLYLAGAPLWLVALGALWPPVGMVIVGNGGRTLRSLSDIALMLALGFCVVALPAVALWWLGHDWMWCAAAIPATALLTLLANLAPLRLGFLGCVAGDPEPTAELLLGGMWAAAIIGGVL